MAQADQVLLAKSTYELVKERVTARPVGMRQLKGKQKEIEVYEAQQVQA